MFEIHMIFYVYIFSVCVSFFRSLCFVLFAVPKKKPNVHSTALPPTLRLFENQHSNSKPKQSAKSEHNDTTDGGIKKRKLHMHWRRIFCCRFFSSFKLRFGLKYEMCIWFLLLVIVVHFYICIYLLLLLFLFLSCILRFEEFRCHVLCVLGKGASGSSRIY